MEFCAYTDASTNEVTEMNGRQIARRFPRVPAQHPVRLRLLGEAQRFEGSFTTKVIGLGGCCVVSAEPLGYSSLLDLSIELPGRTVRTDGRVAYELTKEKGQYEVGVEFLRLLPSDRALLEQVVGGAVIGSLAHSSTVARV